MQRIFVVQKTLDYTGIDGNFGPQTWATLPAGIDAPELAQGASGSEITLS